MVCGQPSYSSGASEMALWWMHNRETAADRAAEPFKHPRNSCVCCDCKQIHHVLGFNELMCWISQSWRLITKCSQCPINPSTCHSPVSLLIQSLSQVNLFMVVIWGYAPCSDSPISSLLINSKCIPNINLSNCWGQTTICCSLWFRMGGMNKT